MRPRSALVCFQERHLNILIRRKLEREGYSVTIADSGASALKCIREQPFGLLVIEEHIADRTPAEVIKALRADPRNINPQVFVIDRTSGTDNPPFFE